MKTVTEFTGLEIKYVLKCQTELLKSQKDLPQKNQAPAEDTKSTAQANPASDDKTVQNDSNTELTLDTTPQNTVKKEHEVTLEQNHTEQHEDKSADVTGPASSNSDITVEDASQSAPQSEQTVASSAPLQPKNPSWKEKVEALRPQLIEALKNQFSWKNEDRYNLAIDASRSVNPKMQDVLRKVTAYKKDKEDEKTPKFAQEIGELIFLADYIIIKKDKPDHKDSKDGLGRKKGSGNKGKRGFKHKDFKDGDKPAKKIKKPIPNPIKSNNKTVVVEKK